MNARIVLLVVLVAVANSVSAQQLRPEIPPLLINDLEQSTVALHPATPYLEASTAMLVEVDLQKLDLGALDAWLGELMGADGKTESAEIRTAQGMLESLKNAGASRAFITASTRSVTDRGPIVIVPCQNTAIVEGLATVAMQSLWKGDGKKVHASEKVVLVGTTSAIDRVVGGTGAERSDLITALKQRADGFDHSLVFTLPTESRQILASLWPDRMPESSPLQFSPRAVVEDVNRVILSFRLPPHPEFLIKIETTGFVASERINSMLDKALVMDPKSKESIRVEVSPESVTIQATPTEIQRLAEAMMAPVIVRSAQKSTMSAMKQLGIAIHNYVVTNEHLPPRCFTAADATPLLSWRVALCPFIEQQTLYNAIQLDQSWDSPANAMHTATAIPLYMSAQKATAKTTLRAPVFPGSLWYGDGPPKKFADVIDGLQNTIALIDAPSAAAIEWTNPKSWILSAEDPMSDVFGERNVVTVLMLDGSARRLKKSEMTNQRLKKMLTIAGQERID
ncbi:MAG: DUF1559 domain-containing protein [Rubripirellula sp.]